MLLFGLKKTRSFLVRGSGSSAQSQTNCCDLDREGIVPPWSGQHGLWGLLCPSLVWGWSSSLDL